MSSPTVLLIVDDNPAEGQALASALTGATNVIHTATSTSEAAYLIEDVPSLSAMVAAIPETDGASLFDFRDKLQERMGRIPTAFCSKLDMSPYYGRVKEGDKLFFKPVEIPVMKEWIASSAGPPAQAPPNGSGPQSTTASVSSAAAADDGVLKDIASYDEELPIGIQLGDYKLERIIQRDQDFALYEAEQTSISRKVAIKTLYRKHRTDPAWVQAFVNEASARAKVNHPNVSLVYECVQEEGVNFYTLELVDAPSLADMASQRANLGDNTLWGILESCCSALEYFRSHQMQHRIMTAQTILIQNGDQTRIANPVKGMGKMLTPDEEKQQMQYLSAALKPFIRKGATDPGLYSLIDRLGQDRIDGIVSMGGLRRALNDDTTSKTAGLPESRIAEITEKELNKKAIVMGGLIGLIIVVGGIAASLILKKAPEAKEFNKFSHVPAGPFPFQDAEPVEVPDFWMAQQEVTIAQYAEFLEFMKSHPTTAETLKHPDQPKDKSSYFPQKWALMYDAAKKGKKFSGAQIDPNCPVIGVDWWDAYTYARWRNARLPTEQEWEKAARGRGGNIYPWGNEMDYSKFNSGIDQKEKDDQKPGSVDGYQFWSPVDAKSLDMSRYGINGMAGNVSEWTATWDSHPDNPDKMVPIKRGGSFATSDGFESTIRRAAEMAEERNYYTGFRIISDVEPGSDPSYRPPPPERISTISSGAPSGKSKGTQGKGKGKGDSTMTPPAPAPDQWDPADGPDPFKTIFATPVGG